MQLTKALRVLGPVTIACAIAGWPLQAGPWHELTKLYVYNPIAIPGAVLVPGDYMMRLANPGTGRDVVQFFNADETKLIATTMAIPDERLNTPSKTRLTFYEAPVGDPPALRSWFYPGENIGVEFVYPKSAAIETARNSHRNVLTMRDEDMNRLQAEGHTMGNNEPSSYWSNTPVSRTTPNGTEISNEEGHSQNRQLDQNPAWETSQQKYQKYANTNQAVNPPQY